MYSRNNGDDFGNWSYTIFGRWSEEFIWNWHGQFICYYYGNPFNLFHISTFNSIGHRIQLFYFSWGNKSKVSCIRRVESTIQSKYKRVIENGDSDVRVFVKTAKCIFDLDKKNLGYSLLFPEDVDDFLPELKKNDNGIYIEGLSVLFHTGNLVRFNHIFE